MNHTVTSNETELEKLKDSIYSTFLSAVDALREAQYKIEIAQTLYADLMDDHFDKVLNPTHDNQVIFFSQRDVIHNKAVALMEFVMQAYADVTKTLASIEAKCDELKENER